MLQVKFDSSSLMRSIEGLKEKIESGVIIAAQAGAQVFYDEVRARVPTGNGLLKSSIYQWRDDKEQRPGHAHYRVSWRKGTKNRKSAGSAELSPGTGLPSAFHGQLIEYGWTQRYAVVKDKNGHWWTVRKPEYRGKEIPKYKGARNQAARNAFYDQYFVKRPGGTVRHAPKSFLRSAYDAKEQAAGQAMLAAMRKHLAS